MEYQIVKLNSVNNIQHKEILNIWKESIKCTQDFLSPGDFEKIHSVIKNGNIQVEFLFIVKDIYNNIAGFMAIDKNKLEMLYVHPKYMNKGYGKNLLQYAIQELNIKYIDVNSQNIKAINFYKNFGFIIYDKSKYDKKGRLYPLTHMKLKNSN